MVWFLKIFTNIFIYILKGKEKIRVDKNIFQADGQIASYLAEVGHLGHEIEAAHWFHPPEILGQHGPDVTTQGVSVTYLSLLTYVSRWPVGLPAEGPGRGGRRIWQASPRKSPLSVVFPFQKHHLGFWSFCKSHMNFRRNITFGNDVNGWGVCS